VTALARAAAGSAATHAIEPDQGQQDARPRLRRSALSLLLIGVLVVLGVAGLSWLGVWQLERRVQKLDLIDRVTRRMASAPVAAPGPAAWPRMNASDDAYRRVHASGRLLRDDEVLVKAVTELGEGFWVVTPLRTGEGFTVLVNRGFVPSGWQGEARTRGAGDIAVTGLLRMTEPKGGFLRSNDPEANRWYSRDVAAIGATRGLRDIAPYFIDADASANAPGLPRGGLTAISFPNNHLVYASTWFALALMVLGGGLLVARDEWRIRKNSLF
jgi:surfeit locus 1 family protein